VLTALAQPYSVGAHELQVTPSIGISMYPADGNEAESLLIAADAAMYYAKEMGRGNFQLYQPSMRIA
jgi:diguanylate cyclase (GGDEF)-like protein